MITNHIEFKDTNFQNGYNGVELYNNEIGKENTTLERLLYISENTKENDSYFLRFKNFGCAKPNLGGWKTTSVLGRNGTYICKIIAIIPIDYDIFHYCNYLGEDSHIKWLTPQYGTGEKQLYMLEVKCDNSDFEIGNFGYFTINGKEGTKEKPVIVDIYYHTIFKKL